MLLIEGKQSKHTSLIFVYRDIVCVYEKSPYMMCFHFYGELWRITHEGEQKLFPFSLASVTL